MRRSRISRLLPISFLTALLPACASDPGSPFGSPATGRDGPESYRIRFEASCDRCTISWSVGPHRGDVRETGTWSERVRVTVFAGEYLSARLSAGPMPGSDPVSWVRIRVNGDVVAEASGDRGLGGRGAGLGVLSVRARIPPEGERVIARRHPGR